MTAFTNIQLERLPLPEILKDLNFEVIFQDVLDDFLELDPEYTALVESDPAIKLLQTFSYHILKKAQEINDTAKACMLAYAKGSDLDQLGALFKVERQLVTPADPTTRPPTPAVYESDTRFRTRIQLSPEGYTTAGSVGSYIFWGLSASPQVKDIDVYMPTPGQVMVTILSTEDDGTPAQELLDTVEAALNAKDIRPLTDEVLIQAPTQIFHYDLIANLYFYEGPDPNVVKEVALEKVTEYVAGNHLLGHDITESGLHAALHQPGVQRVEIISPDGGTIVVDNTETAICDSIELTIQGVDE